MNNPIQISSCYNHETHEVEVYALCSDNVLMNPEGVANFCPPKHTDVRTIWKYSPLGREWERMPEIPKSTQQDEKLLRCFDLTKRDLFH